MTPPPPPQVAAGGARQVVVTDLADVAATNVRLVVVKEAGANEQEQEQELLQDPQEPQGTSSAIDQKRRSKMELKVQERVQRHTAAAAPSNDDVTESVHDDESGE